MASDRQLVEAFVQFIGAGDVKQRLSQLDSAGPALKEKSTVWHAVARTRFGKSTKLIRKRLYCTWRRKYQNSLSFRDQIIAKIKDRFRFSKMLEPSAATVACDQRNVDFQVENYDVNIPRKKKKHGSVKLLSRHLRENAMSSVFLNAPNQILSEVQKSEQPFDEEDLNPVSSDQIQMLPEIQKSEQSDLASVVTAENQMVLEELRAVKLEQSSVPEDPISNLTVAEVLEKLSHEVSLPSGFTMQIVNDCLAIYCMEISGQILKVAASVIITKDFSVSVTLDSQVVPESGYSDIFPDNTVSHFSQLLHLLARIRCWKDEPGTMCFSSNVNMAIQFLKRSLETIDINSEEFRHINFLIEQLHLRLRKKFSHVYNHCSLMMSSGQDVLVPDN